MCSELRGAAAGSPHTEQSSGLASQTSLHQAHVPPEPSSSRLVFPSGTLDLFPRSRLHPRELASSVPAPDGSAEAELTRHPHFHGGLGLCRRQALRQGSASRTHEGVLTRCQDQPGGVTVFLKEMMPRPGPEEPAGVG